MEMTKDVMIYLPFGTCRRSRFQVGQKDRIPGNESMRASHESICDAPPRPINDGEVLAPQVDYLMSRRLLCVRNR
jgi:hypothetical protein